MEQTLLFILIIITFFAAGWLLLISLTVHPVRIYRYTFLFAFALITGIIMVMLSSAVNRISISVIAGLLSFITGYLNKTIIFLGKKLSFETGSVTRTAGLKGDHTAIVYFTHGEPETYDPTGWLNQFREFDSQRISFIPFFARPVFIFMLRQRYLKIGRSNHRSEHFRMLASLTDLYLREGRTDLRFYICFLDDDPRPEAAVIKALNNGASMIIVANVFLTISNHTAEGRKRIDMIGCYENYGVEVSYTDPLWDSETLMKAFSDKIHKRIGEIDKSKVAVALIGHGQPDEWDREWPTLTEQETLFRNRIIELLHQEGFRKEFLGNAWLMFKKPEPVSLMKKFIENGAEKILYFASSISADAIPSQSEIPGQVNRYDFPPGTELINMGAWNDHPLVIKAIKEKIDLLL